VASIRRPNGQGRLLRRGERPGKSGRGRCHQPPGSFGGRGAARRSGAGGGVPRGGREGGGGEGANGTRAGCWWAGPHLLGWGLAGGRGRRRPYRTPTLVGRGNSLKVDERSPVKELGNLTP